MLGHPDGIGSFQGSHILSQLDTGWWPLEEEEQADAHWDLQHDVHT